MKKKVLSVILTVAMAAGILAGCGSSSSDNKADDTKDAIAEGDVESDEEAEAETESGEREIVNLWFLWSGQEAEAMLDIVEMYNNSQDKYEVVGMSTPDAQKIIAGISGGNGPDIVDDFHSNVAKYAEENIAMPLDELIERDGTDLSVLLEASVTANQYNGKQYALPCNIMGSTLYYNIDMLKEAGYDEPPANLDELLEMAANLTKVENGMITQLGYPFVTGNFDPWVAGAGYDYGTTDNLDYANEGVRKTLEIVHGVYEEYGDALNSYVTSSKSMVYSEQDPFFTGQEAFRIDGSWIYKMAVDAGLNVGTTVVPSFADQGDNHRTFASFSNFYIPSTSKNVDGAWDFLKWLTLGDGAKEFSMRMGNLPALESLFTDPDVRGTFDELTWKNIEESELIYAPVVADGSKYSTAMQTAWDAALLGDPVDEIMSELESAIE